MCNGLGFIRPEFVNSIIRGRQNQENIAEKAPRMAMTVPVMKLLKHLLTTAKMNHEKRRLIWTVACLAFHGSFRIHELLSRKGKEFDPTTTLLGCDLNLHTITIGDNQEEVLMVHLKSPKEEKLGGGITVELFSTGTFSCPVKAYKKWKYVSKSTMGKASPAFRRPGGQCYTGNDFNKDIKTLLGEHINYDEKRYLSHSFRAGMASMMASAGR